MKSLHFILLCFFSITLFSCSEPTIEDDARKAAELSTLSNKYTMDNDMSKAGNAYVETQEIMNKYKRLDKFDEFYQLYISYLQENSYLLDESSSASETVNTEPGSSKMN